MFVCKNCIDKFEPVVALATFYKTCEICGEERDCLDLSPNVKRIDISGILELIIEHKDGKFINWSMRDPNDPTRKFGEDDTALVEQIIGGFPAKEPKKEGGLLPDPYGDGVGWACKCGHGSHSTEQPPNFCPNCGTRLKGEQKANLDEMWEWINRDLDDGFFEIAGKLDKEEQQERMDEIPDLLKPLAYTIITLACTNIKMMDGGGPCILFRHELFAVHKELLEKGIDIHLPYAWFCDGIMINPEWIVRITNGIVGWSCDPNYDNPDTCGLENCRYKRFNPSTTTKSIEPCSHPEDKIVFVNEDVATLLFLDEGFYCKECKERVEPPPEDSEKEPEIHPDILKAARGGATHYSTEDGQQYLVTFIGLKETAYEGMDPSPEDLKGVSE